MDHKERRDFHAKFEEALSFVCRLHAEQTRKQTDIPYISHLIGVAGMVLEQDGDADLESAILEVQKDLFGSDRLVRSTQVL